MSPEAKMQPDPMERFRSELENARWNFEFLANYVSEVSQQKREEDIFHRMAFQLPDLSENASTPRVSALSELYEATSPQQKAELRRWWHDRIRREVYRHDDLRTRLSWRFLV